MHQRVKFYPMSNRNNYRIVFWGCIVSFIMTSSAKAQSSFPPLQRVVKPSPAPLAPGDQFAPIMTGKVNGHTPKCAEWTRTAGPNETMVITGINFTAYKGTGKGRDTRFVVYSRDSIRDAKIQRIDGEKAIITLD